MCSNPRSAHIVAFAEGTFNPVAQMGNPKCFELLHARRSSTRSSGTAWRRRWHVGRVRHRARLRQGARPDDRGQAGARLTGRRPRPVAPRPILQLVGVSRTFGELAAVDRVDLEVREGEFFTVVGPSGSGKTTLLRMLAGMETPSDGDILLRGKRINDLPANRRPTCLVFQSLALFPHRSVGQNIEFPLKMKGVAAGVRRERALELMRMVRLPEDYYGKNVTKCSGGERQRVALARAFAYDPEILFFDEPLSAIDYKLRKVLERELKDIHKETGKTFMYITHSLEEAMVMSDRIGVMRSGRLVQVGTPEDIYNRPADRFVSEFMGDVNVITVMPNGNGSFEGVDVPGHFRAPMAAQRARLPRDPAGIPALRRDQGRGRQRDRRHGLQRVLAGLAHAVPGPRRRQGVRGRALAPRGLGRRPRPAGPARAGTPATPSSCRAEPWRRRGSRSVPAAPSRCCCSWRWASPHPWSRSPPTRSRRPRSFEVFRSFTLANYAAIFDPANTVWTSFAWSLALAAATVLLLAVIAYPIAWGLAHVFGRWSSLVSLLFVFPLFISENIRLYGWVLFFIKGGVLDGTLKSLLGSAGRRSCSRPA